MKTRILSRTMRYILLALCIVLVSHLTFQYIIATATESDAKTGTFVEALTPGSEISYIPYTQTSQETRLYQSLFFDSCLDYAFDDGQMEYRVDLCAVTTNDNQKYVVRLDRDAYWTDRTEVTLDDVYATYQKILVENVWGIPSFTAYKDIAVELRAEDIVVTFPESSVDNRIFFTNFIIPQQYAEMAFEGYVDIASQQSIGSGCARIQEGVTDDASVVFDVTNCHVTNFNKYQLKYISNDQALVDADYVDVVKGDAATVQEGFQTHRIPNRNFVFLFFNVESKKLSPKIQRALGGFVHKNFADDKQYEQLLTQNDLAFTHFLSDGTNVAEYIAANNPDLPVDKYDLEELSVKSLPGEISIKRGDKPVYFLESIDGAKTLRFTVDQAYESISVRHNAGELFTPKAYDKNTKTFYYTMAPYNANLIEWLNEYKIIGKKDGKDVEIASMDVYFLTAPLQQTRQSDNHDDKITIAYVYHPVMDYVVARLQKMFDENGMGDYFHFDGYGDPDSFEGKLLSQNYDIVLRIVNMGQRNDLRSIFAGKNPILNPSLYSEPAFLTALDQFTTNPTNDVVQDNLKTIYGKDIPVVILGEMLNVISIREGVEEQISEIEKDYLYDVSQAIYTQVSLGKKYDISRENMLNRDNVKQFVYTWWEVDMTSETVIDATQTQETE